MMLQVNCPIVGMIKDKIDGLELDGVTYKVKKLHALILDVNFTSEDSEKAKGLLLKYLHELPEMGSRFLSIKITDDLGNIL